MLEIQKFCLGIVWAPLDADNHTGVKVKALEHGGQGSEFGIQKGWILKKIGKSHFSSEDSHLKMMEDLYHELEILDEPLVAFVFEGVNYPHLITHRPIPFSFEESHPSGLQVENVMEEYNEMLQDEKSAPVVPGQKLMSVNGIDVSRKNSTSAMNLVRRKI